MFWFVFKQSTKHQKHKIFIRKSYYNSGMSIKEFTKKKVSSTWLILAITFWVLLIVELLLLILAGTAFNNLTTYIEDGHRSCAEYCNTKGNPLFLHDVITQACQCYNEAEEPTDYKNMYSGVEIEFKENVCPAEDINQYLLPNDEKEFEGKLDVPREWR